MKYNIPLFELNFNKDEENAVIDTIRSRWISTGPRNAEFEKMFSQMLGSKYAIALSNCTVALHLAMKLLGIKKGDEVICPSLTFVATVNAIRYADATPVFADIIGHDNLTLDPADIEKKITSKTKAIVVMHYAGFSCDMDRITRLAKKYNLKVIEDACHGPLSEYKGKKLGTLGDIGCFSFFSNKNISTGEGGMLVTNNPDYYEKAKLLRSHGMTSLSYERSKGHSTSYDVIELGFNYRMDDIHASIGIAQLKKLEKDLKKRAKIRSFYEEGLLNVRDILIPFTNHKYFSSNYIFPVVLKNSNSAKRDFIRNKLAEAGVQTSIHYPAVHRFSIYKKYRASLPRTEYVADNSITLPMYSGLTRKTVQYIIKTLRANLNE